MFGQIAPTEFDLNFRLFGIPVRVHPVFWLTSAFLAWNFSGRPGEPLFLPRLLVGILCIFFSILVHELGHALMNRKFHFHSEVVLYFFGGYATSTRHSTWKDIAVSAAGPAAGFVLCGLSWLGMDYMQANIATLVHTPPFDNPTIRVLTYGALVVLFFVNLVWNLANLIPVSPLDGGQISRELFLRYGGRNGMGKHLQLSMVVAGAVAAFSLYRMSQKQAVFGLDPLFLALMFGYLCYQNFQMYEQYRRGGYW